MEVYSFHFDNYFGGLPKTIFQGELYFYLPRLIIVSPLRAQAQAPSSSTAVSGWSWSTPRMLPSPNLSTKTSNLPVPIILDMNFFRRILVIFMEEDTENEANMAELSKTYKNVKFIKVNM